MAHSIPLEEKFWSKVIKGAGCWEWTASVNTGGYSRMTENKTTLYGHRVSYEIHKGPIPAGMHVDHICRNRRCVNPNHLRLVTNKQNHENLGPRKAGNKSGHRGVFWLARTGKWKGTVKHNRKCYHVGYFNDLEDAAEAVRAKRNELYTHNYLDRTSA